MNPHAHDPLEQVGMPRSYPPEFRRKVLDLIAAGDCTKPGGTQLVNLPDIEQRLRDLVTTIPGPAQAGWVNNLGQ